MNLRRVSSWLPPIQRWMGVEDGGGDADQVSHPQGPSMETHSVLYSISRPDEPPALDMQPRHSPEMDAETKGEVNRLWSPQ